MATTSEVKMIKDALEQIGLSKNEILTYDAILDLGNSTVSEIAKHSQLHRSNTYDSLQKLVEKGLVNYYMKDKSKFYQAGDPNNLLLLLKQKEVMINAILPELISKYTYSRKKSEIVVHEGIVAFRTIMLNQLTVTKKICVISVPKSAVELITSSFLEKFHKERIKNKIDFYHLLNNDYDSARISYLKKMKYTHVKILPSSYNSPIGVNIFDETVLLTVWLNPIISIEMKSPELANAYRSIFNILWDKQK